MRHSLRFGATVTVREQSGEEATYRIVGTDESDPDRGWVSWLSPIARALMNAQLGERIRFKFPAGEEELEIVNIAYE
jgi:transcription elongation factor GreB